MITDFIFDEQELSGFGYILCDFNSSSELETSNVSDMSFTDVKSPLSNISHNVSASYTENLRTTKQIMKNPCDNDNLDITDDDLSELSRWLCRKDYKLFKWVDDKYDDEVFYEVQIKLRKIELGNGRVGAELDIVSNRPFGITREIINELSLTTTDSKSLIVFSDEEGYIYPDATIIIQEAGDLELVNEFENRTTYISKCKAGEVITIIGGDTLQITSSDLSHDLSKCYNYKFPRLCTEYMNYTNTFSANIACDVEIKYRGIRKVGI